MQKETEKPQESPTPSFDDFPIPIEILRALYTSNYEKPTFIQNKLLSALFSSKDVFITSQENTGKTSSFIIYTLSKIDITKQKEMQVLVLAATRDSAQKIELNYKSFCKHSKVKMIAFLGGTSIREDIQNMNNGCQIVVGTPGRIQDMINKKIISLSELKIFIVDEIFELVNRGFTGSLKNIVSMINPNKNCQKLVINSNIEIKDTYKELINFNDFENIYIDINDNKYLQNTTRQFKISLKEEWKFETLINLYKIMELSQLFLFCKDKKTCEFLNEELTKRNFISGIISEDRDKIVQYFKKGYIRILISFEEICAKDFDNLHDSVIINYDMPKNKELYFKRISRPDCFVARNIVINFVVESDNDIIEEIQSSFGNDFFIEELPVNLSYIEQNE